ncbi:MAG: hypothetical protein F6K25_18330 [Okeania sp. SIO2G4]|nr:MULTISPECIES: hypothetical protein [unclassified Okeania]NEP03710.1 hypothetical protein [Okeania sp. SIO4D6]NEP72599.1 hypothetical protein [Okeania sp. SIO2G5]NEP94355.1 hypothetical protein [Okeania sp. SIO2F5]NEQ92536.1 hypothetical protein [Okeania sp. SIO2G4]
MNKQHHSAVRRQQATGNRQQATGNPPLTPPRRGINCRLRSISVGII